MTRRRPVRARAAFGCACAALALAGCASTTTGGNSAIIVSGAFQALRTNTLALGAAFRRGSAVLIPVILTAIVIGIVFVLVMLVCTVPLTAALAMVTQGAAVASTVSASRCPVVPGLVGADATIGSRIPSDPRTTDTVAV